MIDLSLLQEFIAETAEHLEETEVNLLTLEKEPNNGEVLNDVFRSIHTIKGSAEYMGLQRIAELSHALESILELLRQGQQRIDTAMIDTLIGGRDAIALLVGDLERCNCEETSITEILGRIQRLCDTNFDAQSASAAGAVSVECLQTSEQDDATNNGQAPTAGLDEAETYEEEVDGELFAIFVEQLKETLAALKALAHKTYTDGNKTAVVKQAQAHVDSLKSAANYMGYEKLIVLYQLWQHALAEVLDALEKGEVRTYEHFMDTEMAKFVNRVLMMFPQIEGLEEKLEEEPFEGINVEDVQGVHREDTELHLSGLMDSLFNGDEFDAAAEAADIGGSKELDEEELELFPDIDFPHSADEPSDDEVLHLPASSHYGQRDARVVDEGLDQALFKRLGDAFDSSMAKVSGLRNDFIREEIAQGLLSQPPGAFSDEIQREDFSADALSAKQAEDAPIHSSSVEFAMTADETESVATVQADRSDHVSESQVSPQQRLAPAGERLIKQSLRVDSNKIDLLINQVGELVVSRAWFSQLFNEMKGWYYYLKEHDKLSQKELKQVRAMAYRLNEATASLGRLANDLQEGVMRVRMLPIAQLFSRYARLVRDLVREADKQVHLDIKGEETELDKMVIEEIADPLIHLIRNAVDHGIEAVTERKQDGKPETGTITLEAFHESNHVVVQISDDGRGISIAKIKAKAMEMNLLSEHELEAMSDQDLMSLITRPGFSTAAEVTHTSGRGVGMDVVKKNIENLNGTLEIDSELGRGTRFRIKIPLTLAIIPALLVRVGHDLFTLPLSTVEETLRIFRDETTMIEGVEVIQLRETTLPLLRLSEVFNIPSLVSDPRKAFVVVVSTGLRRIGLVVDALLGQEEVVIKPLADYIQEGSGFSGATILGDGRISLILDIYELVNLSMDKQARQKHLAA